MPTFDGETLIITLDPVVDGVLDVDIGLDLYTEWKTWMRSGNMRYPEAFRTTGGDELTSIINAGSYFFLRNDYGWRVKSYENDGTYYLVGNLAVQDTTLPAFIPTTGTFTAAILGLQPVTQGVTPAMAAQLEANSFAGAVCIDSVNGTAGTGYVGLNPVGTRQAPSNNIADAKQICVSRGFKIINFITSYTIVDEDMSDGFTFTADSPFLILTVLSAANVSTCSMRVLTIQGEMDGLNLVEGCRLLDITKASGMMHKIALSGDVTLSGPLLMMESYSNWVGEGHADVTVGSHELEIRDFHGSFGIHAMTGGNHSIGITEGRLIIDADCTGGTIYVRGTPYEIVDNSAGAVTIVDQTMSTEMHEIWQKSGLDPLNPVTATPTSINTGDIAIGITGDGETTSTATRT